MVLTEINKSLFQLFSTPYHYSLSTLSTKIPYEKSIVAQHGYAC
jgi:hypothetical protein